MLLRNSCTLHTQQVFICANQNTKKYLVVVVIVLENSPDIIPSTCDSTQYELLTVTNESLMRWRLSTSRWCWTSYSTLPPPGGVLQTQLTKTGSKRLRDAELNSVSSKILIPLHHNSLKILTTNYSEHFCTILNMSSTICCQTELIIHLHSDLAGTTALSVRRGRRTLETF